MFESMNIVNWFVSSFDVVRRLHFFFSLLFSQLVINFSSMCVCAFCWIYFVLFFNIIIRFISFGWSRIMFLNFVLEFCFVVASRCHFFVMFERMCVCVNTMAAAAIVAFAVVNFIRGFFPRSLFYISNESHSRINVCIATNFPSLQHN